MLLTEATSPGTNIVYTIPIKRTMHANVANKLRLVTGIFFNCGYFYFNFAKSLSNIFIGTFKTKARIRPTIIGRVSDTPLCSILITSEKCMSRANSTTPNVISKRLFFVSFSIKNISSPFFITFTILEFKNAQTSLLYYT